MTFITNLFDIHDRLVGRKIRKVRLQTDKEYVQSIEFHFRRSYMIVTTGWSEDGLPCLVFDDHKKEKNK